MNIMVISDIHANHDALKVFAPELRNADLVLCLGDIVGYNAQVNEAIDALREIKNMITIMGNHDMFLLRGCPSNLPPKVQEGIQFADRTIRSDNRAWLSSLPVSWGGFIDGSLFYLVHGSPWSPFCDYMYQDSPLLEQTERFEYDVLAFGQTHRSYLRQDKGPILINPGSIGQSRDRKGFACALQLCTRPWKFNFLERPID